MTVSDLPEPIVSDLNEAEDASPIDPLQDEDGDVLEDDFGTTFDVGGLA